MRRDSDPLDRSSRGVLRSDRSHLTQAQQAYTTACPDLRGCGCQDHTETGELVPAVQPPPVVVATCDGAKCIAHVQK